MKMQMRRCNQEEKTRVTTGQTRRFSSTSTSSPSRRAAMMGHPLPLLPLPLLVFVLLAVALSGGGGRLILSAAHASAVREDPSDRVDADADVDVDDVTTGAATSSYSFDASSATTPAARKRVARFVHGTVIIPHDDKKHRGGEDAAATSDDVLVVADGVGGWANKGVNPGLYSRLLAETVVSLLQHGHGGDGHAAAATSLSSLSSSKFLIDLVEKANHFAADRHLGSATCTTVRLLPDKDHGGGGGGAQHKDRHRIQTLNIGDSGYSIHRYEPRKGNNATGGDGAPPHIITADDIRLVYSSVPGQRSFNFPYQIGGKHGDAVQDVADLNVHDIVSTQDVLVVYSDGVSDNLSPRQYHECIAQYTTTMTTTTNEEDGNDGGHPDTVSYMIVSYSLVADCIARQAYFLGKDQSYDSPFARGAKEAGKRYRGGKHDDITVTVAQVVVVVRDGAAGDNVDVGDYETHPNHNPNHPYVDPIYVYTGPVPPQEDLPTLEEVRAAANAAATAVASAAAAASSSAGDGNTRPEEQQQQRRDDDATEDVMDDEDNSEL